MSVGNRQVWPSVVDVAVSVLAVLFGIGSDLRLGIGLSAGAVLGFGATGAKAVLFRRRWPVPVLTATHAVLQPYLTSNAGSAFTSVVDTDTLLSVGGGIAVFVGWIMLLLGAAAWRMTHKDA